MVARGERTQEKESCTLFSLLSFFICSSLHQNEVVDNNAQIVWIFYGVLLCLCSYCDCDLNRL